MNKARSVSCSSCCHSIDDSSTSFANILLATAHIYQGYAINSVFLQTANESAVGMAQQKQNRTENK